MDRGGGWGGGEIGLIIDTLVYIDRARGHQGGDDDVPEVLPPAEPSQRVDVVVSKPNLLVGEEALLPPLELALPKLLPLCGAMRVKNHHGTDKLSCVRGKRRLMGGGPAGGRGAGGKGEGGGTIKN